MRNFHDSIKLLDLIKGVDTWGQTTMEAEDVSLDNGGEWKVVEQSCESLPDVGISVLSKAFIVESVDLGDLLALVVTSENGDSVWVSNLENDEESDCLNRVVASIDVISHEEIVVVGELTTNFEKFFQIVELSVDISTDSHGGSNWLHVTLVDENLFGFLAKSLDAIFGEGLALAECFNLFIKV